MDTPLALIVLTSVFSTLPSTDSKVDATLKLVHVVFRHGDRTPTISQRFPTDAQINETYYPFGKNGELTLDGKKHSYALGKHIRKRYDAYLGGQFYSGVVNSSTSDAPRTQMTLQLVHASLFPPKWNDQVATLLSWQPVTYRTVPWQEDDMLMLYKQCPEVFEYDGMDLDLDEQTSKLYDYVSTHTGFERDTFGSLNMFDAYDTILVESQLGYAIPEWAKPIYPEPMRTASLKLWHDMNTYKLPLAVGPLINHISLINEEKASGALEAGKSSTKMFLFSCHDSNIAALLGAVDYHINEAILYNAAIYIELHLINKQYGIKMFYQNGVHSDLEELEIKKCGTFCPLEEFQDLTRSLYDPWPVCA